MANEKTSVELIKSIQGGDYGDFEVLLEMYRPLIEAAVSKYCGSMDPDDIRQTCFIAFFNAARSYDTSSEVAFGYYAKICVTNALRSELRKKNNKSDHEQYDDNYCLLTNDMIPIIL